MIIELDRDDLISLVKGTKPNYSVMEHPLIRDNGRFDGSRGMWHWNYKAFEKCTDEEILEAYKVCKESWK